MKLVCLAWLSSFPDISQNAVRFPEIQAGILHRMKSAHIDIDVDACIACSTGGLAGSSAIQERAKREARKISRLEKHFSPRASRALMYRARAR